MMMMAQSADAHDSRPLAVAGGTEPSRRVEATGTVTDNSDQLARKLAKRRWQAANSYGSACCVGGALRYVTTLPVGAAQRSPETVFC